MKLKSICKTCKIEFKFDNFTVEATNVDRYNLKDLSYKIESLKKTCTCGEVIKNNDNFIAIDLEKKYMICQINDVPPFITINHKTFELAGVIGLPSYGGKVPHYTAYCYKYKTGMWTECDSYKTISTEFDSRSKIETRLALLIYIPHL